MKNLRKPITIIRFIHTTKWLLWICIFGSLTACKETGINGPEEEGVKPAPVTNVKVTNQHGAATITYSLTDENARYVVAEYEPKAGVARNAKASKYKNEILLDGFPKEGNYQVTLYAVGAGEQKSDPVTTSVDVLTPPVVQAYASMQLKEDFGGMNISFDNPDEGDLAIDVLSPDSLGKLTLVTTQYTRQAKYSYSVRGFAAEPRLFKVVLRDRWQNLTDTASTTLTPIFELQLDRTRMAEVDLPGDTYQGHTWSGLPPRAMKFLFDGNTTNATDIFHTVLQTGIPQYFTFTLSNAVGKEQTKFKLSRFKLWMRNQTQDIYNGMSPRVFELYGSNDPNPDGSWDSWSLISQFTMEKPSGLPRGEQSAEDLAMHTAGNEFNVPFDAGAYHYLRFKTLETWGLQQNISMAELAFWGAEEQ